MRIIGTWIESDGKARDLAAHLADNGMQARALDQDRLDAPEGGTAARPGPDGMSAIVVDTCGLEDAQADALVARLSRIGPPVLAVFRLPAGVPFRLRREALMAAGAADVCQESDDLADLMVRIRSLCILTDQPRILVVDDDMAIADWVGEELREIGMQVVLAHTLEGARAAFRAGPVDAMIVDRQLPDGDGLTFVEELRRARIATPALLYTAMTDIADRVDGLERAGADDYLCKPAHANELRARVRVLLRPRQCEDQLIFGPLELSRRDRIVRWRGARVDMRRREIDMLIYLAERAGLAIPQQMLYLDIWEKVYMDVGSNPVSATKHRMVAGLRKFIEAAGETCPAFIETGGNCYTFRPEALLDQATSAPPAGQA